MFETFQVSLQSIAEFAQQFEDAREIMVSLTLKLINMVNILSYCFGKKIPLSRHVEYVMDGSMDE